MLSETPLPMIPNTRPASRRRIAGRVAGASLLAIMLAAAPLSPMIVDDGGLLPVKAAYAKSCFVAGTRVLMADGGSKAIEDIRAGDMVAGRHGANLVCGIEHTRLGNRQLYALNGGVPFVTAEHPLLSPTGWRALDPAMTAAETPGLTVGALRRGDLVAQAVPGSVQHAGNLALAPGLAWQIDYVALGHIDAHAAPADTPLFNLLLAGDHSYVANGFVVHNKGGGGGGDGSGDGGGSGSGSGSDGSSGDDGSSGPSGNSGPGSASSGDDGHGGHGADDSGNDSAGNDDGTPDQGHGDAAGTAAAGSDDGTPDQGPGDAGAASGADGTGDDGTPDQGPGDR